MTPAEVSPPGEFISEELEARGWTQEELAEMMIQPLWLIKGIISGKQLITAETAAGLGYAFGTTTELWMNLQTSYVSATCDEIRRRYCQLRDTVLDKPGINNNHLVDEFLEYLDQRT